MSLEVYELQTVSERDLESAILNGLTRLWKRWIEIAKRRGDVFDRELIVAAYEAGSAYAALFCKRVGLPYGKLASLEISEEEKDYVFADYIFPDDKIVLYKGSIERELRNWEWRGRNIRL